MKAVMRVEWQLLYCVSMTVTLSWLLLMQISSQLKVVLVSEGLQGLMQFTMKISFNV